MPLRRRGETWHVDVTAPDGRRIRQSADTTDRQAAQEYHDKLKAELWSQARLGIKPKRLWEEAAVKYLHEKGGKKSIADDARHISWWTEHFLGRTLQSISRGEVAELVEAAHQTPATRNRYVATLRALLRMCQRELEWIGTIPAFKTYKEPSGRIRWLTHEEAARVLDGMPPYLRDMAEFALATGLRQANLIGLTWDRVDMTQRSIFIPAAQFKGGKDYSVPLNSDALAVIRRRIGKHKTHVFTDQKGRDMSEWPTVVNKAWLSALAGASICDFTWHDLRHTWATWHVHAGTDIYTLRDLGGWKSIQMPMRYAHLSLGLLAKAAERVTKSSQLIETTDEKKATEVA